MNADANAEQTYGQFPFDLESLLNETDKAIVNGVADRVGWTHQTVNDLANHLREALASARGLEEAIDRNSDYIAALVKVEGTAEHLVRKKQILGGIGLATLEDRLRDVQRVRAKMSEQAAAHVRGIVKEGADGQ